MDLKAGTFIKSTKALDSSFFEDATIFISEHNEKGAIGFILNKPAYRTLNQLEEFRHAADFPIHIGGPVDQEHLFVLHRRPDLIEESKPVDKDIYFGGNFTQTVKAINEKTLLADQIKIFIGYCGWNNGELEAEIDEGSWEIMAGSERDIFEAD